LAEDCGDRVTGPDQVAIPWGYHEIGTFRAGMAESYDRAILKRAIEELSGSDRNAG